VGRESRAERATRQGAGTGETRGRFLPASARIRSSPWIRASLVSVAVVVADQLSKRAVEHSIVPGEERKLLPGIELVHTRNRGVAFGLLPRHQTIVTILIALALLVLLVYFARHRCEPLMWLPTGMLVGGAIGNVVDRLRDGAVTDFVKLPLGWPPFNLADAAITIGIVILLVVADRARHAGP
jgi:signal peptidase II